MDRPRLSYALVTPARDEAANLTRLFASVVEQTLMPRRWIVVDNGSTDETTELIEGWGRPWILRLAIPGETRAVPGAPIVRAFHAGVEALGDLPDVVVKLDADVSFGPSYFEEQLRAFEADPMLGIASGVCLEDRQGMWWPVHVTEGHARGAVRAYRRKCLLDVLPLEERMGWDGIDELKASVRGWHTGTVMDLSFQHHRGLGSRDGRRHVRWVRQGEAAYYMGYRPSYLLLRTVHRSLRNPAALAMLGGYVREALRRSARYDDAEVRAYLRNRQSLRHLVSRAREVRGQGAGVSRSGS